MEVQNISGPDLVNAAAQNTSAPLQNENTAPPQEVQTVSEQDKGTNFDSYA